MLEQKLLKQITKIKILQEEGKKKKKLKLFHFDNFSLTMTILPTKFVPKIFWFRKYTLYLHRELVCYH